MLQRARAVITAKDVAGVEELRAQLQARADSLDAAMNACNVPSDERLWLRAAMYGVYELLALCDDVGHEAEPEQPAKLTPMLALVAPGTEAHLLLSLERLLRAGEISRTGPETEQAAKECILVRNC